MRWRSVRRTTEADRLLRSIRGPVEWSDEGGRLSMGCDVNEQSLGDPGEVSSATVDPSPCFHFVRFFIRLPSFDCKECLIWRDAAASTRCMEYAIGNRQQRRGIGSRMVARYVTSVMLKASLNHR
ncbi:hypothetical protein Tcan_12727 [Toxocara canis]|uniref:Uncharacterized protein n=1 Tax=Toxocara canis TaxID=6265 RepID=A0A0B2W1H3_TOXCA|nr:hypothetical protein Tcan_12727 [Toxocara canis]